LQTTGDAGKEQNHLIEDLFLLLFCPVVGLFLPASMTKPTLARQANEDRLRLSRFTSPTLVPGITPILHFTSHGFRYGILCMASYNSFEK